MIPISQRLRELWVPSSRVCMLTGAGVSAESGVPTFRDKDGLWSKFKPEELASMDGFLRNPSLVAEWYEHRRQMVRGVKPNAGHFATAAMEKYFSSFVLSTQNVDGLHAAAGSARVLELHGNIMRSFCVNCEKFASEDYLESLKDAVCESCGGLLRPDVVWFGEMLPAEILSAAQEAAASCDLFLTVGTSGAVFPAAGLPLIARESGAYVVEVNPVETELSGYMDEVLRGPSAVVLPELMGIR